MSLGLVLGKRTLAPLLCAALTVAAAVTPSAPVVAQGKQISEQEAQAIAGDRTVGVAAGTIARQCLELGLLDQVAVDLVPVVMGKGRPYFGTLSVEDVPLGDPTVCIQGDRVTHLLFPTTAHEEGTA